MAEPERWQVSTDAAEADEPCFVPAIFGAWAGPVADAAGIGRGDRVPDVGWGTGVLAREALRRGDAASLPFEDAGFDVVVSQFALM
jgi:ubiquinone/menaquinone biosynthesis C-methylase UbiE